MAVDRFSRRVSRSLGLQAAPLAAAPRRPGLDVRSGPWRTH